MPFARTFLLAAVPQAALVAALATPSGSGADSAQGLTVLREAPPAVVVQSPAVVRGPAATPRPTRDRRLSVRPAGRRTGHVAHALRQVTFEDLMMRAVHRIPGYRAGLTQWRVSGRYGHWGTSDVYHRVVYIAPWVPRSKLYSVVVHEWGHMLTVHAYGGDVAEAASAMNAYFGGSGWTGGERAADCIARLLGATWTNYTSCTSASWRHGARRLIAGERV